MSKQRQREYKIKGIRYFGGSKIVEINYFVDNELEARIKAENDGIFPCEINQIEEEVRIKLK